MKCGTPLQEGVIFCHKCGATVEQQAGQQPPVQPQQQPMAPQQPHYNQTQPYAPIPAKSNKKLIIAVIAIVAIIVIIGLLVFFFVLNGADGRFIGEWESDTGGYKMNIKFNSDGTAELGTDGVYYSGKAKWNVDGDKICFEPESGSDWSTNSNSCMSYKFSGNDNKLTLDWPGFGEITFTKK